MKSKLFLYSVLCIALGVSTCASAATTCIVCADDSFGESLSHCGGSNYWCKQDGVTFVEASCDLNGCMSGYKSVAVSSACSNIGTRYICEEDCTGCTNCSSTSWTASGTGYQKRTVATCNCNTCSKTTQYRCAAGYYGSSTNGTSGCTQCPQASGVYSNSGLTTLIRGTSAAGSTAQTSCYIPSGTVFYDSTGSGKYDGDSYYCN